MRITTTLKEGYPYRLGHGGEPICGDICTREGDLCTHFCCLTTGHEGPHECPCGKSWP